MKEQDLLKAIRNADRSFYEKAEQRMHHRKEHTVKNIVMRKIMTGAAAAAVLAVTVTGGIYLANRTPSGLTEPSASTQTTAPIEVQNTKIVTAVTEPAAAAVKEAPVNCFGGHGQFQFSRNSDLLCDDDFWYMNTLDCAPKSDAKYLPLERITASSPVVSAKGMYLSDKQSDILYRIVYQLQADETLKEGVYTVTEDGTETLLNFGDMAKCFAGKSKLNAPHAAPTEITHLKDGKYYVTGYLYEESEPDNVGKFESFWEICDTNTQTGAGQLVNDTSAPVFYDGDTGVYTASVRHFVHRLADGSEKDVFQNEGIRYLHNWFVDSNCIYYLDYYTGTGDYCKYDMKTKKTTVLRSETDWNRDSIFYADGKLYAISVTGHKLLYGSPDLSDMKEMDLQSLDSKPYYGMYFVKAVFGNTVVVVKIATGGVDDQIGGSQETIDNQSYMMLYHTDTGAVQYLYDPAYIQPSELPAETTAPAVTTAAETTAATAAATTAATTATTAAATTTAAAKDDTNLLGGHGKIRSSSQSFVLEDDEYWYETLAYRARKSDSKYIPSEEFSSVDMPCDDKAYYLTDEVSGEIYHILSRGDKGIYKMNDDGTETMLLPGLYSYFRQPDMPDITDISVYSICHMQDSLYYIDGKFHADKGDEYSPAECFSTSFWAIFDAETKTCKGQLLSMSASEYPGTYYNDPESGKAPQLVHSLPAKMYPDGNGGIYVDEPVTMRGLMQIIHCKADGTAVSVMGENLCLTDWFLHNDCIYYLTESTDYCKYDLKSKQTTVIAKNTGWQELSYDSGTLCTIKGSTLVYSDPDLTDPHEWKIELPANMEQFGEDLSVNAVFGNTIMIYNNDIRQYTGDASGDDYVKLSERHDYKILYHTDTGKVQFIYKPKGYTPPAAE